MQEGFLKKFIEEERYLQNPPLRTKDFIDFCEKRGVNTSEEELEFFEKEGFLYPIIRIDRPIDEQERIEFKKDGKNFWRPLGLGLEDGEEEVRRYKQKYYSSYEFNKSYTHYLLTWLEEGNLFDPSTKSFEDWSYFKGETLDYDSEKIVSFYSSFQIHWLEFLKDNFSYKFNFASKIWNDKKIENSKDFIDELQKRKGIHYFDTILTRKKSLKTKSTEFEKILEFFLSIQEYYYPYGRSASRTINIKVDSDEWWKKRRNFDPQKELQNLNMDIKEVSVLYWLFSKRSMGILGKNDDLIQLWKNISWNKKNRIEGNLRLGIEYLQWALMLKKFMEDYCKREILDIDEIGSIAPEDVVKVDPSNMDKYGLASLRYTRNKWFKDPQTGESFYHDRYKRLFYLANAFELDYQPRIMVFVEGKSEEKVLPKVFERIYNKPENVGIEIVNFKGVDQLLSTSKNAEELRDLINDIQADIRKNAIESEHRKRLKDLIKDLKDIDIIISNWTSFISYNLDKWQIIPFFISDNEGNVKHFLEAEKPIKFKGKSYNVPEDWKFLWGINNGNKPFCGKDLEFANFTDEEITTAINNVLNENIKVNKVKEIRESGAGINKIHEKIKKESGAKIKIVDTLFENLFNKYEETEDESLFERPIFDVIEKIMELATLNHLPVDTDVEIRNKEYILSILKGEKVMEN